LEVNFNGVVVVVGGAEVVVVGCWYCGEVVVVMVVMVGGAELLMWGCWMWMWCG
jgi:hypothetical protein